MADNLEINTATGTALVSTDELAGGIHAQRFKAGWGGDGVLTDVSAATPLPVETELPPPAALADGASAVPTTPTVGALVLVYNGSTADRLRTPSAADDSGSAGVIAAGLMGHDAVAAVNRRVKVDAKGILYARPSVATGSASSRVTASVTSAVVLAANASRLRVILVNESAATLYLAYAATATPTAYTYLIGPGATWEMPDPLYPFALSGIWTAASGAAQVTELT